MRANTAALYHAVEVKKDICVETEGSEWKRRISSDRKGGNCGEGGCCHSAVSASIFAFPAAPRFKARLFALLSGGVTFVSFFVSLSRRGVQNSKITKIRTLVFAFISGRIRPQKRQVVLAMFTPKVACFFSAHLWFFQ